MDKRQQQPRILTVSEKSRLQEFQDMIHYSTRYEFEQLW